jgi:hypothetical protein
MGVTRMDIAALSIIKSQIQLKQDVGTSLMKKVKTGRPDGAQHKRHFPFPTGFPPKSYRRVVR